MCKLLVVFGCVVALFAVARATSESDGDISQGMQIVNKLVRQFLRAQGNDVRLGDGVHLINTGSLNDARAADDGSLLGTIEGFLKTHEINIKLTELMPEEGFARSFKDAMEVVNSGRDVETGRKKVKGAGGIILVAAMMAKMMAALGLGGVGLLAMKALMVSALALMLSMIIGLKKLVSGGHDDGGHTVIHASGGHDHRRKRDAAEMAYQAWNQYSATRPQQ